MEKIKRNEQRLKAMGLDKPLIPKPKPKKRQTVTKGSELKVAIIIFLSKTLILLPNPQRVSANPSRSSKRQKKNHQINYALSSDESDGESETDGLITKRVEKSTTYKYNPGAFLSDNEEEGLDESAEEGLDESDGPPTDIRGIKFDVKTGQYAYLLKWEGYPETENTWEKQETMDMHHRHLRKSMNGILIYFMSLCPFTNLCFCETLCVAVSECESWQLRRRRNQREIKQHSIVKGEHRFVIVWNDPSRFAGKKQGTTLEPLDNLSTPLSESVHS